MPKLTDKTRGKKILCNPPVAAAIESAEKMIEKGWLNEGDVQELIDCDEELVLSYNSVMKAAIERLR